MIVTISPTQIKEIAGELDAGMKCFYHIPTGEVKRYPDELRGHAGFEGGVLGGCNGASGICPSRVCSF